MRGARRRTSASVGIAMLSKSLTPKRRRWTSSAKASSSAVMPSPSRPQPNTFRRASAMVGLLTPVCRDLPAAGATIHAFSAPVTRKASRCGQNPLLGLAEDADRSGTPWRCLVLSHRSGARRDRRGRRQAARCCRRMAWPRMAAACCSARCAAWDRFGGSARTVRPQASRASLTRLPTARAITLCGAE